MSWVLDGPWQRREVVWPSVRIAVGPVGLLIAWYGCSGTLDWTEQSWWIALAAAALIIALTGVATWIKVGLRNLRHLERLMLGTARAQLAGATAGATAGAGTSMPTAALAAGALVTVPGTTLVHQADCLLVAGKSVRAVEAPDSARLETCGMCRP